MAVISGAREVCPVARMYDYVLAVWLRLEVSCAVPELLVELREYLEAEYVIIKLTVVEANLRRPK